MIYGSWVLCDQWWQWSHRRQLNTRRKECKYLMRTPFQLMSWKIPRDGLGVPNWKLVELGWYDFYFLLVWSKSFSNYGSKIYFSVQLHHPPHTCPTAPPSPSPPQPSQHRPAEQVSRITSVYKHQTHRIRNISTMWSTIALTSLRRAAHLRAAAPIPSRHCVTATITRASRFFSDGPFAVDSPDGNHDLQDIVSSFDSILFIGTKS